MGWFFNKNNNSSDQNTQNDPNNPNQSHFSFHKSFSSTKRSCKNDPEDNQFMICKTVIKDDHGTRQEQERIPVNNSFVESSSPFRNPLYDRQKTFDGFPSLFTKPSIFDLHNSTQQPNMQNHSGSNSFFKSYSRSSSCREDPEDQNYLICKSKIKDQNGPRQIEQRVKVSERLRVSPFEVELGKFGHEIDQQMHDLMNELSHGMNFIMPLVGSMMRFATDLQNFDKSSPHLQQGNNYFQKNGQYNEQRPNEDSNRYFSTSQSKKDTNIYDL